MNTNIKKATLAGGCFWCLQPIFDQTNYKMYHDHSGREEFIEEHWGKNN